MPVWRFSWNACSSPNISNDCPANLFIDRPVGTIGPIQLVLKGLIVKSIQKCQTVCSVRMNHSSIIVLRRGIDVSRPDACQKSLLTILGALLGSFIHYILTFIHYILTFNSANILTFNVRLQPPRELQLAHKCSRITHPEQFSLTLFFRFLILIFLLILKPFSPKNSPSKTSLLYRNFVKHLQEVVRRHFTVYSRLR
jgi:hypothetical protein